MIFPSTPSCRLVLGIEVLLYISLYILVRWELAHRFVSLKLGVVLREPQELPYLSLFIGIFIFKQTTKWRKWSSLFWYNAMKQILYDTVWFTTSENLTCKSENRLWNYHARIINNIFQSRTIFVSFFPRICLLGNKLLASSSYHECSRNDTLLNSTYGNDETFWKDNPLSYVVGVPGITSGVFVGKIILQSNQRLIFLLCILM